MRTARLFALALLVAACGGAPVRTAPNGLPIAVVDQECQDRIKPLYDALRDLESRLNVGLSKVDYTNKLGDVRVVYDAMVRGGAIPSGACFDSAKKLEDAINEYVAANNSWGDCIQDTGCTVDEDALPGMQAHWSTATDYLDEVALAFP